ncbi:hypothetical protein CHARACLAT_008508 [Characodon lateralis]|uniref:Uncharacterized protein n=1 Tax=Characodon lateralis TaxID=208331 RepID=A0ABU7DHT2_9TELE|nr:hypothetical protein [Characodon lateralis]
MGENDGSDIIEHHAEEKMEKKTPCLPRCWRTSVRPRERATASPSPPTEGGSTVMPSSPLLPQSCQEEKPDSMLFYTYLPKEPQQGTSGGFQ